MALLGRLVVEGEHHLFLETPKAPSKVMVLCRHPLKGWHQSVSLTLDLRKSSLGKASFPSSSYCHALLGCHLGLSIRSLSPNMLPFDGKAMPPLRLK